MSTVILSRDSLGRPHQTVNADENCERSGQNMRRVGSLSRRDVSRRNDVEITGYVDYKNGCHGLAVAGRGGFDENRV